MGRAAPPTRPPHHPRDGQRTKRRGRSATRAISTTTLPFVAPDRTETAGSGIEWPAGHRWRPPGRRCDASWHAGSGSSTRRGLRQRPRESPAGGFRDPSGSRGERTLTPCVFASGARAARSQNRDPRRCATGATPPAWKSWPGMAPSSCSTAGPAPTPSAKRSSRGDPDRCADMSSSATRTGTTFRASPSSRPSSSNEATRLVALRRLGLLDTPEEKRFGRITRLAQRLSRAPIALITLVDADRQWFKSRQGLDVTGTPRDAAICAYAILSDDTLVVPDTLADPRFADNPLVVGSPRIRFYAGHPLHAPDGHRVGTLCVIDHRPPGAQRGRSRSPARPRDPGGGGAESGSAACGSRRGHR